MFLRTLALILGSSLSLTAAISSNQAMREIRFQQEVQNQDNNFLDPVAKHRHHSSQNENGGGDLNTGSGSAYGQLELAYDFDNPIEINITTGFNYDNPSTASFVALPLTQTDPSLNILFPSPGVVQVSKDGLYRLNCQVQRFSSSTQPVLACIYTSASSGQRLLLNSLVPTTGTGNLSVSINQIIRMSAGDTIEFGISSDMPYTFSLVSGIASIIRIAD